MTTSDREIVVTRRIKAPRPLVWEAFSDPQHITSWWGPHGFTTTTHHMDMRPGGEWRFTMHGPDGTDYENHISYLEVVKPSRLVYRHSGVGATSDIRFTSHISLTDEEGDTRVTLRLVADSKAERDTIASRFGAEEGGRQTLMRLDEHLSTIVRARSRPFVITRSFKAPRDLVWKAWTEAEHLSKWWGPKGCTIEVKSLDVRPGGRFHYAMRYSSGAKMWGLFTYVVVDPPQRLVYRSSFSTEDGGVAPAPFPGSWPSEIESIVTLGEWEGMTTLRLVALPFAASDEERSFFESMFGSLEQGFGGTFESLADHLRSLRTA